jgi:hypothetical protein
VAEAYRHVADGCRHALSVPGLPDVEVEGLRTILRAALQITEQPLLWSVTTTNHQEDRMTSISITLDLYGHLMPGNEDEAAVLLDAYLTRVTEEAARSVAPTVARTREAA